MVLEELDVRGRELGTGEEERELEEEPEEVLCSVHLGGHDWLPGDGRGGPQMGISLHRICVRVNCRCERALAIVFMRVCGKQFAACHLPSVVPLFLHYLFELFSFWSIKQMILYTEIEVDLYTVQHLNQQRKTVQVCGVRGKMGKKGLERGKECGERGRESRGRERWK